ncbi:MAG: VCBS repeat-containing protein [Bacteroidetes bacterium]|nr:VCBS repeat-containing protein [Bacteroidota bacterium]
MLSGTVFAGTAFQGVYASIDNGNSWTAVNTGLTTTSISALVVNGTSLFAGTNAGVFISVNGGSSWSPANTGLSNTTVQSMAVTGSLIFAGTSSGVFSSSNNGANWSQVYNGGSVYSMAASSSNVFAGTNGGVVYSSNSGSSWGTVNNGLTNTIVFSLTIDGSNTYAGTMGGVFHTVNNGASWTEANAGITGTYIYTLAINGTSIYAGTATQGIYLSTNNGSAWTPVNSGLTTLKIRAIAFNGSNLFAGTFGGGVFLSTNGGSNWTAVNSGLSNTSVNALAITGSNIFAGTDGGGVFLSSNNGSSWSQVNSGLSGGLFVNALAVNGSNIFAGTNGGGVFLSTNNGGSWTPVNTGLTSTTVNSLAVSGSSTFAGTMGGVFLSTNNGSSWTAMNTGLTSTYVPVLSVSDNKIFAGTDLGIFMANAAGGSWTAINAGLSAPYVHALSCTSSGVFAGSYPGSVWLRSFLDFVPAISSFSPASGSVGTSVTISGSYFDPNVSNNVVHFGATRAIVNSATSSQLQVTVPSGSTYEPISVTVNGLTAYASQPFLVTVTNLAALNATAFAANVDFAAGNLNAVALADIDGDGRTDILTANNSSSKLSVFRNTATSGVINTGSFAAVVEFASASQPNSIATGDLDGDGKLDVVVGSLSGTISVYLNTSTSGVINSSSLAPKVDLTSLTPRGVAIRDLDKDGKPDIIVVNGTGSGSTLSVFRNISTIGTISASSFDPKVDYTVTIGLSTGLYVGDFDGDGKPDVGTSNDLSSTISILRNNSVPGGFSASSFDAKVEFASGYNPKGITGGDIDGDGKIDLVTSNGVGTVSIFKNSSTGSGSILFVKNDTGSMGGGQIVLGDIDADGLPDLAGGGVAAKNTSIPGSLTFASNVVFNTASQPTGCSISDLDGDGIADLAISTFGGSSISVIRNLLTVVPPPTITGFNPQSGYPLSQVTITGTNFNPDPINNTVSFNGVAGTASTSITNRLLRWYLPRLQLAPFLSRWEQIPQPVQETSQCYRIIQVLRSQTTPRLQLLYRASHSL